MVPYWFIREINMIMIPKKSRWAREGPKHKGTVRSLIRGFTIITYNVGVYIPPTARCDNASGIGKNTALTQRDRLPFFHYFRYLCGPDRTRSV